MTVLLEMAIREFVEKMEMEFEERWEYKPDESQNPLDHDDAEDLATYLDPYQNDQFGNS